MGWIIKSIYGLVQNYGVAIILFTVLIKLLILPLNIKSQKAMRKQQKIQPIMAELQKKYANDPQKLQQETVKLYRENNVSMTGGCLPLLIQMPVLIALYQAIQRPLTYMFGVQYKNVPAHIIGQIDTLKTAMLDRFPEVVGGLKGTSAADLLKTAQIQISKWAQMIGEPKDWGLNFDFLGLDLSSAPSQAMHYISDITHNLPVVMLLIIPVLAVIGSIAQNKITMFMSGQTPKKDDANNQAQSMNKAMVWMMPVMTAVFTYTLPAGLGLYWIVSSVFQIVQQIVLYYYFEKKGEEVVVRVPEKRNQHGKKSKKR